MRKALLITTMLLVLCLTGCASYTWNRAYSNGEQHFKSDLAQCDYEIALHQQPIQGGNYYTYGGAIGTGLAAGIGDAIRTNNLRTQCMTMRGWYKDYGRK